MGWTIQDWQGQGILSSPKHPASYSVGNGFLPAEKQWEHEFNHASSSSAEIKNEWSSASAPPMHGAGRDNFTFCNFCGRNLLLYLRKEKEVEGDISYGLLLYTVCL